MSDSRDAQERDATNAARSTSPSSSNRPQALSRSPRFGAVAGSGWPLPASGVPASIDSVGPQEQVSDEMGQQDEQEPPRPPQVVRLELSELDHRQVERDGERQPDEQRCAADDEDQEHSRIVYEAGQRRK